METNRIIILPIIMWQNSETINVNDLQTLKSNLTSIYF